MDAELVLFALLAALGGLAVGLAIVGHYLVKRDTLRKGRWGINPTPACRQCDVPAPPFRMPNSLKQTLWGGWTCAECGYELDKWGEPVAEGPFPAKWSAEMDDPPSADDRIKGKSNDIERKGDYRD